jgi:hypothetical protein
VSVFGCQVNTEVRAPTIENCFILSGRWRFHSGHKSYARQLPDT